MRQNLLRTDIELIKKSFNDIDGVVDILEKKYKSPMLKLDLGDPIAGGEVIPTWLKQIVQQYTNEDTSYQYSKPLGDLDTRKYVLKNFSSDKICTVNEIIFFNGVGEAINKILSSLPKRFRVLLPSPVYPAYASAESLHAGCSHIYYNLDPNNNWTPNLEEMENKVRYNDLVVAIVVINPNNPTGACYDKETLIKIIKIAKKYDCFLIFDEIYHNMYYQGKKHIYLHEIIDDTPAISMKGISKDISWPGSRCGWIEIYNIEKDDNFEMFINTIMLIKKLEVSSTILPQLILKDIYSNKQYKNLLQSRLNKYEKRADIAYKLFKNIPNTRIIKPSGIFYFTVELLSLPFSKLKVKNKDIRLYLDTITNNHIYPDIRFSYELMGAKNICVAPLTTFGTTLNGFRITLFQENEEVFVDTLLRIKDSIYEYYGYQP